MRALQRALVIVPFNDDSLSFRPSLINQVSCAQDVMLLERARLKRVLYQLLFAFRQEGRVLPHALFAGLSPGLRKDTAEQIFRNRKGKMGKERKFRG